MSSSGAALAPAPAPLPWTFLTPTFKAVDIYSSYTDTVNISLPVSTPKLSMISTLQQIVIFPRRWV